MDSINLDCKGLACPMPVLKTEDAIEKDRPETINIVVDNDAARQNVQRFLEKQGYATEHIEDGGLFTVKGTAGSEAPASDKPAPAKSEASQPSPEMGTSKALVLITTETIGAGDDELGAKLMAAFLATLEEMDGNLWRIILLNGGVKLTTKDSPGLDALKKLEDSGVSILVCGTCLDFFGLLDEKQVGETTNMLDVVTSLDLATKVIRP